jgi:hypothetical protein
VGRGQKMMKVTYICRWSGEVVDGRECAAAPKTHFLLYFTLFLFLSIFYRVFRRFVTRGVQKHDKTFFKKIYLGSPFLRLFYFPSVVLPDFFYRVFGRLLTRGVQQRD